MKKICAMVLIWIQVILLVACSGSEKDAAQTASQDTVRIAGLKGPTAIGMVKLMQDAEEGKTEGNYEFTLAGSADEVTPALVKGELDIAAIPANLSSVLYHNTDGQVRLLAVNTLGVLYLVEKGESIQSIADLKGRTIIGSGKGSTPEYSLRYLLRENGLDPDRDVDIQWKSEHAEVVQNLAVSEDGIGLLPQPFVTAARGKVEGLRIALDLTKEWDAVGNGSRMITGVLAVRKDFAEQHPEAIQTFLKEYQSSVDWVNANTDTAAELTERYDIIPAAVAREAIPYCNIVCITGEEMQRDVSGYLAVLAEEEPKSIGGTLPEEDYYVQ